MHRTNLLRIAIIFTILWSCGEKKAKNEAEPIEEQVVPTIFVSNYPLEYFVQRIAGDKVELLSYYSQIEVPTAWEPGEEEINALQQADLVLLNGASFEPWAMMLSLPQSRLVVTTASVEDQLIAEKQTVSHSHGPEGEHEHAMSAYTTWLNLQLANAQAKSVLEALSRLQPEHKSSYEANFEALSNQLMAMDEKMRTMSQSWKEKRVLFSQPTYQYLQEAYGIKGSSLQWAADSIPNKKQWHDFRHEQGHHPFKLMIWDSQPTTEILEQLISRGVETIVFDPCTFPPEEGDFISVMETNIQNLQNANTTL